MSVHTHVGVVGATFLMISREKPNFPALISRRTSMMAPLLVVRIGGMLNFLAENAIIDQRAAATGVTGIYPNCRPVGGDWEGAVISVRNQLQALMIPVALDATMKCVVGIQNDIFMLGVDKVIGAASQTVKTTFSAVGTGTKYAGYAQQGFDKGKKLTELHAAIKKYRGDPVDLLISIM